MRRCCTAIASDFRDTEAELYKLLAQFEDSPVYITARTDGQRTRVDVYINTNSRKALAEAVVYEVGHYFGNPDNKLENTKDTAIIERKAEAWLQTIPPDTYTTKPDLYPGRVFDRAMLELQAVKHFDLSGKMTPPRYEFPDDGITLDGCKLSDGELAAIIEAVGRWVKSQDQAPTAQQIPDELKADNAIKYLERASNHGYWKPSGDKATWEKTPAMLGYFCLKAYDQPRPITQLELFFGVKNLAASITQASYTPKRNDVKKWRSDMDTLIFFD